MNDHIKRFKALYEENETAFKAMLHSNVSFQCRFNVLDRVKDIITEAGIDSFFYNTMENDILKGNFSVIYLDSRMVGEDKKRIKAQKELNKVRATCVKMQQEGKETFDILFSN